MYTHSLICRFCTLASWELFGPSAPDPWDPWPSQPDLENDEKKILTVRKPPRLSVLIYFALSFAKDSPVISVESKELLKARTIAAASKYSEPKNCGRSLGKQVMQSYAKFMSNDRTKHPHMESSCPSKHLRLVFHRRWNAKAHGNSSWSVRRDTPWLILLKEFCHHH